MIALQIQDLPACTRKLFIEKDFDRYLVREARFTTFAQFFIDGHLAQSYFSEEELEAGHFEEFVPWSMLRPLCFSLIRGKRLPEHFSIVLCLSPADAQSYLRQRSLDNDMHRDDIFSLNLRYSEQKLTCVTAYTPAQFSLDKSLGQEWDQSAAAFFRHIGIACEKI